MATFHSLTCTHLEGSKPARYIDPAEHDLAPDDPPHCTSVCTLDQTVVEPILLPSAHQTPPGIIANFIDVVIIPIQRRDASVIIPCIQHDQVHHLAQFLRFRQNLEQGFSEYCQHWWRDLSLIIHGRPTRVEETYKIAPDPQIIVHSDLANRLILEVSSHSIHLTLIDRHTAILNERFFSVVHFREAISVAVIGDLVIIPDRYPWEVLMRKTQVGVSAILRYASAVVIERDNFALRSYRTRITTEHSGL